MKSSEKNHTVDLTKLSVEEKEVLEAGLEVTCDELEAKLAKEVIAGQPLSYVLDLYPRTMNSLNMARNLSAAWGGSSNLAKLIARFQKVRQYIMDDVMSDKYTAEDHYLQIKENSSEETTRRALIVALIFSVMDKSAKWEDVLSEIQKKLIG